MAAGNEKCRQALKLPWRLGGLRDQGHTLATRNGCPILLFVDQDGVWGKAKQADDLWVIRRAEENDLVSLFHESSELAMLLRHPGAGAINHLEAALCCATEHLGGHTMRANNDSGPRRDLIKLVNILDSTGAEVGDQPLVVYDMAQGVGLFPRGAGDLGLINGLTDAIADARALRDDDVLNTSHVGIIAHPDPRADSPQGGGLRQRRGWRRSRPRARVETPRRVASPPVPQSSA